MGGDGAWDHINSCIYHSANWTTAHEHVLQVLERICNDGGFATRCKQVLTSEGSRSSDLEIRNIRLAYKVDLLVDVTIRHDFIGAGRSGLTQGQLRNPDNPDRILEIASEDTQLSRRICGQSSGGLFTCVHVYIGPDRAAYMVNSCVCFSSSPTSKPMTILQLLATRLIRRNFAIAAVSSSTATGAPSAWRVPRLCRCVSPPLRLVATSPPLAAGRPHT